MTKYVRIENIPENLSKEESVIYFPNFIEEVRSSRLRRPQSGTFGTHFTRAMAEEIAQRFDPDFDVFKNIKTHVLNDVPFSSDEDIARKMFGLFADQYPKIFDSYIDYKVRNLPFGTKVVYFNGPFQYTTGFTKNGVEQITLAEAEILLDKPSSDAKKKKLKA